MASNKIYLTTLIKNIVVKISCSSKFSFKAPIILKGHVPKLQKLLMVPFDKIA